jgi:hypothetical protein
VVPTPLHSTLRVISRAFELALCQLSIAVSVYSIKYRYSPFFSGQYAVAVGVFFVEPRKRLFSTITNNTTHLVTTDLTVSIEIHTHVRRSTPLRHFELVSTDHSIII